MANRLAKDGREVTAISLSDQQLDWARKHAQYAVDFRKQDYRDVDGQFDGIVSVEMVEALGREYWPTFMDCVARNLKRKLPLVVQLLNNNSSKRPRFRWTSPKR